MEMKDEFELIMKVVKRAEDLDIMMFDRLSLSMDLETANKEFDLRLDELLKASDFDFAHDIIGIQNNINREIKKMEGLFIPRYANSN